MTSAAETSPTRAPRAPRRRQEEIINAAALAFREKGYEATSIQDIAERVGILKGSLYYYIESKEALLYETLRSVHTEAYVLIKAAVDAKTDPIEKIRAFVTTLFTYNAENLVRIGVYFQDFRSLTPERREKIVAERDVHDRMLRDLIAAGQRQGAVRADVDPKLATLGILGMINWMYHWYKPDGARSAKYIAASTADLVIRGLEATPSATSTPAGTAKSGNSRARTGSGRPAAAARQKRS